MKKHWPRWIKASISKYFDNVSGISHVDTGEQPDNDIPMFIEGESRDTSELSEFVELRIDGPRMYEPSKDEWSLHVEVNILIQTTMSESNWHRHETIIGLVAAAFPAALPIYKYGNGADDDGSVRGCLNRRDNNDTRTGDIIAINNFGQIDKDLPLQQATVEAHYHNLWTAMS